MEMKVFYSKDSPWNEIPFLAKEEIEGEQYFEVNIESDGLLGIQLNEIGTNEAEIEDNNRTRRELSYDDDTSGRERSTRTSNPIIPNESIDEKIPEEEKRSLIMIIGLELVLLLPLVAGLLVFLYIHKKRKGGKGNNGSNESIEHIQNFNSNYNNPNSNNLNSNNYGNNRNF